MRIVGKNIAGNVRDRVLTVSLGPRQLHGARRRCKYL